MLRFVNHHINHHIVVMTSHHINLYHLVDEKKKYKRGNTTHEENARGSE